MNMRKYIQDQVDAMKVGERLVVKRRDFADAFRCGFPSIYNTPMEAFLSAQVGSAWGRIRATENPETGDIVVSKHEESDNRHYVDPDRAHLFKRGADGYLHHIDE